MKRLLIIDNYDSFTYNLVQMFLPLNYYIEVHRNNRIELAQVREFDPDYILISPGPKAPASAGISLAVIGEFYRQVPILGVCLGMQCINEFFGGITIRASVPVHGKTSLIWHNHEGIFSGLPSPFKAARYHSLQACLGEGSPLIIRARSEDGIVMGLEHACYPLAGVQFHPESFLTECGRQIIDNFLKIVSKRHLHHARDTA